MEATIAMWAAHCRNLHLRLQKLVTLLETFECHPLSEPREIAQYRMQFVFQRPGLIADEIVG